MPNFGRAAGREHKGAGGKKGQALAALKRAVRDAVYGSFLAVQDVALAHQPAKVARGHAGGAKIGNLDGKVPGVTAGVGRVVERSQKQG
jgi:hypothetical protein